MAMNAFSGFLRISQASAQTFTPTDEDADASRGALRGKRNVRADLPRPFSSRAFSSLSKHPRSDFAGNAKTGSSESFVPTSPPRQERVIPRASLSLGAEPTSYWYNPSRVLPSRQQHLPRTTFSAACLRASSQNPALIVSRAAGKPAQVHDQHTSRPIPEFWTPFTSPVPRPTTADDDCSNLIFKAALGFPFHKDSNMIDLDSCHGCAEACPGSRNPSLRRGNPPPPASINVEATITSRPHPSPEIVPGSPRSPGIKIRPTQIPVPGYQPLWTNGTSPASGDIEGSGATLYFGKWGFESPQGYGEVARFFPWGSWLLGIMTHGRPKITLIRQRSRGPLEIGAPARNGNSPPAPARTTRGGGSIPPGLFPSCTVPHAFVRTRPPSHLSPTLPPALPPPVLPGPCMAEAATAHAT
ncbi:hypothetical protein DFH09DRAFT_1108254 [Mycena vulgaris]|nr:hypothetical protein DFH09DRAFT_1108254 [Mycena vulgaris]